MSLCAVVPAANLQSANATPAAAGFGPGNFSVTSFTGAIATHAALHAWNDPAFSAAVKALAGVVWEESEGDPVTRTKALIEAQGAQWGANATPLTGNVSAGKLYRHTDQSLWSVIQSYNADTYPDPTAVPALVRRARRPGVAEPWVQPLDQFDAYKLLDPFTGKPQRCLHGGKEFETLVDNNVWTPAHGLQWRDVAYVAPPTGAWSGASVAYKVGDKVTYSGKTYTCRQAHTSQAGWTPTAVPALWEVVP